MAENTIVSTSGYEASSENDSYKVTHENNLSISGYSADEDTQIEDFGSITTIERQRALQAECKLPAAILRGPTASSNEHQSTDVTAVNANTHLSRATANNSIISIHDTIYIDESQRSPAVFGNNTIFTIDDTAITINDSHDNTEISPSNIENGAENSLSEVTSDNFTICTRPHILQSTALTSQISPFDSGNESGTSSQGQDYLEVSSVETRAKKYKHFICPKCLAVSGNPNVYRKHKCTAQLSKKI